MTHEDLRKLADRLEVLAATQRERRDAWQVTALAVLADAWQAEVEQLRAELADTRDAIRLLIGRATHIPWSQIPEEDVDGYVARIRKQEAAEAAEGEE